VFILPGGRLSHLLDCPIYSVFVYATRLPLPLLTTPREVASIVSVKRHACM